MTAPTAPSPGIDRRVVETVVVGAALAASVLAVSSTGSVFVPALALAAATRHRWAFIAFVAGVAAVPLRFGVATLDDLAGIQTVLGPAGVVGPELAAASAWLAAGAVVLGGVGDRTSGVHTWAVAAGAGPLAAALVAGPGTAGAIALRVAVSVAASLLVVLLTHLGAVRLRLGAAVAAGIAAPVCAVLA